MINILLTNCDFLFVCVRVFHKTRENFLATRDKTESLMNKMKDMKKVCFMEIFVFFILNYSIKHSYIQKYIILL